jgi:hypothetical protein
MLFSYCHKKNQDNIGLSSENEITIQKQEIKLLVTLNSIWEVKAIYRDRVRALKNSHIYVSEDLTREESYVFYIARCLKKNNKIINAWTEDGHTYILEKTGTPPRPLNKDDKLFAEFENITFKKNEDTTEDKHTIEEEVPKISTSDSEVNVRMKIPKISTK